MARARRAGGPVVETLALTPVALGLGVRPEPFERSAAGRSPGRPAWGLRRPAVSEHFRAVVDRPVEQGGKGAADDHHASSYDPVASQILPPSQTLAKLPIWWLRNTMP